MTRLHRLPKRLVRWTSLYICLALILTSLAMVPLPPASGKGGLPQGQGNQESNGKARKVKAEPPRKGPPSGTLPNLDEVKRKHEPEPEAPAAMPSTMRSKRKPLEPRRGKKVGDPGTTGDKVGSARSGTRSGNDRDTSVRSHHARIKARATAPAPLGDDQFIQNFFYWAFLRYPNSTEQAYWNDILRTAYPQGQSAMLIVMRELGMTVFESAEYAARNRSNHDYVYDLYKTFLMRDPDSGGWANWENSVPTMGRENVRHGFEYSTEFANLVATLTPNGSASSNAASLVTARVDPNNQTGNQLLARDCEWSVGLLNLPGRAGLDLGLGLSYSSLVWTRSGPYLYFDEDNGWPSPGFRLGFATIQGALFDAQVGRKVYVLITSSGRRVELRQVGASNVYEAGDSSYLQLTDNGSSLLVRTTDGTQMTYGWFENEWRATQIKDRNGNYLTVTYSTQGNLTNLTDTLGRVITVNYDANANPISITQSWNGQTHTWATFGWGTLNMQLGFSGVSVVGTHTGETIPVLTQVGFDDGSRFNFEYTSSGQVNVIRRYRSDGGHAAYLAYDYAAFTSDCPRISQTRLWAENWAGVNGVPSEVVTQYNEPGDGSHQMIGPDGTVYKEFYGTGWQKGLTTQSEVWSGGVKRKWTTAAWTQDNTGVSYQTNPRVTETDIYDSSGNRRRTTIDYTSFGLPAEVKEYAADAATILRRTTKTYFWDSVYMDKRIIGLPREIQIYDQNNQPVSKTWFDYDWGGDFWAALPAAATQHDASGDNTGRGNLCWIGRWDTLDVNNFDKTQRFHFRYNRTGSLIRQSDPLWHEVNVSYADSFSDSVNRNTFAYPTTVTDDDGNSSYLQYNYDLGAKTRAQGPPPAGQSQGVIQTITYDSARRTQQVTTTNNGAYTRYVYGPNYTQSFSTVNNVADDAYAISVVDGLGRSMGTVTNHPGSAGGYRMVNLIYDQMGRAVKQSNPTEINGSWIPSGDDSGTGGSSQSVSWTNTVGVTVNGNSLTSTGSGWNTAGAASTQSIASGDGYVEFTASETNTYRMLGLSNGNTDQGYQDIDFAMYLVDGGQIHVYEAGAPRGLVGYFATGDVLSVAVEGGTVKYKKNGTVLYTSTVAPSYPLLVDTTFYSYGSTLNNVMISGAAGGSGGIYYTQQTYDWKGRPLVTTNTDGTQKYASYGGCGCAGGEVVTLTDEVGRQQKIYSDVLGRAAKSEVLNWDSTVYSTTSNSYNARDQVTLVRQYQGADTSGTCQDTTMSYDGYGRLLAKHVPEQNAGTATTYAYNPDDTINSVTDARGASATYSYNARHLVTGISYSAPAGITPTSNVSFAYDAAGNRTSMSDGSGSCSYSYNQLSQMTSETRDFNGVGSFTLSYGYNLAGELTSITDPTNSTINYSFDSVGRLGAISGSNNLYGGVATYASGFSYRASGGIKSMMYGNNFTMSASYDSRLRPTHFQVTAAGGQADVIKNDYSYYDDGSPKYARNWLDERFDRAYSYDHVAMFQEAYSGSEARDFVNNTNSGAPTGAYRQSYQHDAFGNMTNRVNRFWSQSDVFTASYTNHRRTEAGYQYDADGNLLQDPDIAYAFDVAGNNTSLTNPGYGIAYATSFDGDGQMVKKVHTSWGSTIGVTYYLRSSVLGGRVITEISGMAVNLGQKITGYVLAGGEVLARQIAGLVMWQHQEPLGGSRVDSYSNGAFSAMNQLDPMGVDVGFEDPFTLPCCDPPPPSDPGTLLLLWGDGIPSGRCTLDGIAIDCGWASQIMNSGSAVQCPNNDCGPRVMNSYDRNGNVLSQPFQAFADGYSGFLPPGARYQGSGMWTIPGSRPSTPPSLKPGAPRPGAGNRNSDGLTGHDEGPGGDILGSIGATPQFINIGFVPQDTKPHWDFGSNERQIANLAVDRALGILNTNLGCRDFFKTGELFSGDDPEGVLAEIRDRGGIVRGPGDYTGPYVAETFPALVERSTIYLHNKFFSDTVGGITTQFKPHRLSPGEARALIILHELAHAVWRNFHGLLPFQMSSRELDQKIFEKCFRNGQTPLPKGIAE